MIEFLENIFLDLRHYLQVLQQACFLAFFREDSSIEYPMEGLKSHNCGLEGGFGAVGDDDDGAGGLLLDSEIGAY